MNNIRDLRRAYGEVLERLENLEKVVVNVDLKRIKKEGGREQSPEITTSMLEDFSKALGEINTRLGKVETYIKAGNEPLPDSSVLDKHPDFTLEEDYREELDSVKPDPEGLLNEVKARESAPKPEGLVDDEKRKDLLVRLASLVNEVNKINEKSSEDSVLEFNKLDGADATVGNPTMDICEQVDDAVDSVEGADNLIDPVLADLAEQLRDVDDRARLGALVKLSEIASSLKAEEPVLERSFSVVVISSAIYDGTEEWSLHGYGYGKDSCREALPGVYINTHFSFEEAVSEAFLYRIPVIKI